MQEHDLFYSFLIMPNDQDPTGELSKIFDNGSVERRVVDREQSESEFKPGTYIEWHLGAMTWMKLAKIIDHFDMVFVGMDNAHYNESDRTELGDLVYRSVKTGVTLVIFNKNGFGTPFKTWAFNLKYQLDKDAPKMTPVVTYEMDYSDLDRLVQRHFYRPDFNCVADYEWSNDEDHTGTVTAKDVEPGGSDYDDIQEFTAGQYTPHWTTLLSELARRGVIQEGNYAINVCW